MWDDIGIILKDDSGWTSWFMHEHFWCWLAGFILSLLLLSRGMCGLFRGLEGDSDFWWLTVMIAIFGSAMSVIWHVMMLGLALILVVAIGGGVIAGIPTGLGYACFRWRKKKDS